MFLTAKVSGGILASIAPKSVDLQSLKPQSFSGQVTAVAQRNMAHEHQWFLSPGVFQDSLFFELHPDSFTLSLQKYKFEYWVYADKSLPMSGFIVIDL